MGLTTTERRGRREVEQPKVGPDGRDERGGEGGRNSRVPSLLLIRCAGKIQIRISFS